MWAGRSTPPLRLTQTQTHMQTRTRINSSTILSPSRSIMRVLVLFCCLFLVVVDIEVVTSMSLDRLGIDHNNEIQSDKHNDMNENKNSELMVEDVELEAVPADGETEMYVLLPAGSKSERESVNKNTIESDDGETSNVAETDGDMVMMESNDEPVVQVANLPPLIAEIQKDKVNEQKTDEEKERVNEEESTISEESDDEPVKQVFKNDKDIEDMAFVMDREKDRDYSDNTASATQTSADDKNDSEEESESMVDMLADVVDEVQKEIGTDLVEDTATTADKVVDMLVGGTDVTADKIVGMLVEDTDAMADGVTVSKDEEKAKWEETVEKLEEMGAEKNKEEDDDIELEAAAVMEDILPEEVVDVMAVDDESSEEDEGKKKEKGSSQKVQENSTPEDAKLESPEINKAESNEETKKEENEEPEKEVGKTETELDVEKYEEPVGETAEIQKLDEMEKIEEISDDVVRDEIIKEPIETEIKEQENDVQEADKLTDSDKEEENNSLEHNEPEKEETNNENIEEHNEIIDKVDLADKVETTEATEEAVAEQETNQGVDGEINEISSNLVNEDQSTTNEEKVELSQPESTIQSDELPLPLQTETLNTESNQSEQQMTIESTAPETQQTDTMNVVEKDQTELEEDQPAQENQPEESMNVENNNTEGVHQSDSTIQGEKQTSDEPQENEAPTQNLQETEMTSSEGNVPARDTTMLTTILQIPTPQQHPVQQDELPTSHNEIHAADNKGTNEKIPSNIHATTQITMPSSTQMPQIVISATQDPVLSYVNATNALQPLQLQTDEKEKQKQHIQHAEAPESDNQVFSSQLRRYDGAQVWRIVVQNDRDRRMADELQSKYDGQLWKEVKQEVDYLLKPQVLADAEKHIRAANLSRIVLIDNLQKVIEVENPPLDELADADSEKGHRLTWHAYHRLADIHDFFDYLARTYPEICAVETIGYSVQKRPLKVLKISNGKEGNPGVWIDGGMHAREWISPASVTYIANQLAEGWEDLPYYMRNINWYIHAVANPDGYEYSHTTDRLWRKNMRSHGRQCPGVDLNRNFGFKWGGKGTSANPCSQTYRGNKAFSEPETFYISKFISGFPRDTFHAFLSFHSYGQYILYPWGYDYLLTKDRSDLDRVARAAATTITRSTGVKYTVGPSALTLYPAAGGSDDWAKGIANIKYTYTVEMGDSGRYGFILPASHIETNGKDAYTFVQTVARAISNDVRKRTIKLK